MDQRVQLEQFYGLQFPDSFYTFWEFADTDASHYKF